jgi:hypothetical protein
MSRFDDALREALRRQDPGPDFTARVLARASNAPPPKPGWWQTFLSGLRPARLRWAAAGAFACLLLAGGLEYRHEQQQMRQGEAAKDQLMLALRIAGDKLNVARDKVRELNAGE